MNDICIIAVYFGPLPACFGPWLTSCRYNRDIDFLLVTDQTVVNPPGNVRVLPFTLHRFKELADRTLNMNTALHRPYKCCDFKPVYGVILQEYIERYQYWGHCDLDLVFGSLNVFFRREGLEEYDKFLPLGHLTLYRNTGEVNGRYRLPADLTADYKQVFTKLRNFAFDEFFGINRIYEYYGFPKYDKRIFADISIIHRRFRRALGDKNYSFQTFYWERGKTYRAYYEDGEVKLEELLYVHFKQRGFAAPAFRPDRLQAFYITPKGFVAKQPGVPSLQDIRRTNPHPGVLWELLEHVAFRWGEWMARLNRRMHRWRNREEE